MSRIVVLLLIFIAGSEAVQKVLISEIQNQKPMRSQLLRIIGVGRNGIPTYILDSLSVSADSLVKPGQTPLVGPDSIGAWPIPVNEDWASKLLTDKKGKVLLVNLWATWCGPCVREFPELVKLRNVYYGKGLEVILVSVDDIGVSDSRVKPFLEKQKVTFPSYIKSAHDDRRFFDTLGKNFRNVIPTTFVYNREGVQVLTAIGAQTYDDFEKVVKPLLSSRPEAGEKK